MNTGRASPRTLALFLRSSGRHDSGGAVDEQESISIVDNALADSARVKEQLRKQAPRIASVARRLAATFQAGGRLYACGNGGSACDAMHFVEELVARYKANRPGLPAHHLLDAPTITCWSNDFEY